LWSLKLQYHYWGKTYCPSLKSKFYFSRGDSITVGQAKTALPVQIKLKDPLQFPHQKQYPLKHEWQQGILPIINSLKQHGLLVECLSPYNTPILAVRKGTNKWRLVPDL
jgi:hypothetical protein